MEIFIALIDEGTSVWRPVDCIKQSDDTYLIPSDTIIPSDEEWEFEPGTIVRCEEKRFSDGTVAFVAVEKV